MPLLLPFASIFKTHAPVTLENRNQEPFRRRWLQPGFQSKSLRPKAKPIKALPFYDHLLSGDAIVHKIALSLWKIIWLRSSKKRFKFGCEAAPASWCWTHFGPTAAQCRQNPSVSPHGQGFKTFCWKEPYSFRWYHDISRIPGGPNIKIHQADCWYCSSWFNITAQLTSGRSPCNGQDLTKTWLKFGRVLHVTWWLRGCLRGTVFGPLKEISESSKKRWYPEVWPVYTVRFNRPRTSNQWSKNSKCPMLTLATAPAHSQRFRRDLHNCILYTLRGSRNAWSASLNCVDLDMTLSCRV